METKKTREQISKAEEQIYLLRKSVRHDIRELTIEIIVQKYEKGLKYDETDKEQNKRSFYNTLFVPDYQRDFTWDKVRQSRFIESILLGLPIPLVFIAENKDGAWEIVDGSQRIRTLHAFYHNELVLSSLEKLDELNGFLFSDLDEGRQTKFNNIPFRMIVLSEEADDEAKRDMFERINRGSDLLKPMEKRKGAETGILTSFIYNLVAAENEVKPEYAECSALFSKLAPIDNWLIKRQEKEALLLRYFALTIDDNYTRFPKQTGIEKFLDHFLATENKKLAAFSKEKQTDYLNKLKTDFLAVLKFVQECSIYGFSRTYNRQTKRVVFEAIAAGVHVALKKNPELLIPKSRMADILNSDEFRPLWSGDTKLHDHQKVKARVEFIAQQLLNSEKIC